MKQLRTLGVALLLFASTTLGSCATTHLWRWGLDYSSAIDEPKHEMTAAVTKPLWTLVWTPVALVWDAVTFPPQVLFGVYPYGDSHMQPATRLDSK